LKRLSLLESGILIDRNITLSFINSLTCFNVSLVTFFDHKSTSLTIDGEISRRKDHSVNIEHDATYRRVGCIHVYAGIAVKR